MTNKPWRNRDWGALIADAIFAACGCLALSALVAFGAVFGGGMALRALNRLYPRAPKAAAASVRQVEMVHRFAPREKMP